MTIESLEPRFTFQNNNSPEHLNASSYNKNIAMTKSSMAESGEIREPSMIDIHTKYVIWIHPNTRKMFIQRKLGKSK